MIFYVIIPNMDIQFNDFNDSFRSRLQFFIDLEDESTNYDTFVESLIPGTLRDKAGHFVLRFVI